MALSDRRVSQALRVNKGRRENKVNRVFKESKDQEVPKARRVL